MPEGTKLAARLARCLFVKTSRFNEKQYKNKIAPGGAEPSLERQQKYFKIETTLDCGDFFPFASSAVKGYFFEILVSNILVTSLPSYFGALPRQRDHFSSSQHLIVLRYSRMWDEQSGCCPPDILGLQRAPHV